MDYVSQLKSLPFTRLLDALSAAEHADVCERAALKKAIRHEIEMRYSLALFNAVDNDPDGRPSSTEAIGDLIVSDSEVKWYNVLNRNNA